MTTYKYKDLKYPSVTTILSDCTGKEWLAPWATKEMVRYILENCETLVDEREGETIDITTLSVLEEARWAYKAISKEALGVGSATHGYIEDFFKKDIITDPENEQENNAFGAFLKLTDDYEITPFHNGIERTIFNHKEKWAGTLDFNGYINEEEWVLDWKTSKKHSPADHGPQIAAYASTRASLKEGMTARTGIVLLDKETGEYDFKEYTKRYETDLRTFKLAVPYYYAKHPIIAKKARYWEDQDD